MPGGDGQFELIAEPTINASGHVAVLALLKNTAGGANDDVGILYYDGINLTFRARENQPSPDGYLFAFTGYPNLNGLGHVVFPAELKNTPGGANDDFGVYSSNGVSFLKRARENDPTPEGNGKFDSFTSEFLFNNAGHVAFQAQLRNTTGGVNDDSGIYLHNGSNLLAVVRENDFNPFANGYYSAFGNTGPVMNSLGQVAFTVRLKGGGVSALDDRAIFLHGGGTPLIVARTNALVPEGNGRFRDFEFPLPVISLNAAGQVAFHAVLSSTAAPGVDDSGLYLHNGASIVNRVRENANTPDGNGRFSAFGVPTLNASGQMAFRADLRGTSGGIGDDKGICDRHSKNVAPGAPIL
ncbi:MAG: hypothetical protein H0T51_22455 [Pirellulales bacterium]|nr:hypothetical protein [Pirellulales bacterium]